VRSTPIRDQLGLNEPSDSLSTPSMGQGGAGKRAEMARLKAMREDLRQSLGALPAPENEYQVCVKDWSRIVVVALFIIVAV